MSELNGNNAPQELKVKVMTPAEMSNALLQVYNSLGTITIPVAQAERVLQARAVIVEVNNSIVATAEAERLKTQKAVESLESSAAA